MSEQSVRHASRLETLSHIRSQSHKLTEEKLIKVQHHLGLRSTSSIKMVAKTILPTFSGEINTAMCVIDEFFRKTFPVHLDSLIVVDQSVRQSDKFSDLFIMSDDFLRSPEWRRLRYKVLVQQGAKCACCGSTPQTGSVMNVDHIKPRKLFPHLALDINNLQVLCAECNHGKGNLDQTDWRKTTQTDER